MNKWVIIGIIAVLAAGAIYASGWNVLGTIPPGSKLILDPQFGTYCCEQGKHVYETSIPPIYYDGGFWGEKYYYLTITCPGNTQSCKLGYNLGEVPSWAYVSLWYHYVNVYGVAAPDTYQQLKAGGIKFFDKQFLPGESVYIKMSAHFYGAKEYDVYRLVQHAHNGYWQIANPDGCMLPVTRTQIGDDSKPPEVCVFGCALDKTGSRVDFNQCWNYLGGYALAPYQQSVTDPLTGRNVYCQDGGYLYSLKEVRTEDATYYVRDLFIRKEQCCPWETLGAAVCENLKWKEGGASKCDAFGTPTSCDGAGQWVIDYSDPYRQTLKRATGCDAFGACQYQKLHVECTSDEQCVNPAKPVCVNYVCQASVTPPWTPICGNNVCETGERKGEANYCPADCDKLPYCGDGICQEGEDPSNCPGDCPVPLPFSWNMLWICILGALGGLIGYKIGG